MPNVAPNVSTSFFPSFQNINIFLREKPEWFLRLTPIGKVPIMVVGDAMHFESLVTRQVERGGSEFLSLSVISKKHFFPVNT